MSFEEETRERERKERTMSILAQLSIGEIEDGITSAPEVASLCRTAVAQGCVLLKNDAVLPINKEAERVSVFGRCQNDWFYVGYGSGGDVKPPYRASLMQGLQEIGVRVNETLAAAYRQFSQEDVPGDNFWGDWPGSLPELVVSTEMIEEAAATTEKAIVIIGRSAGEDKENEPVPGSWYLTAEEKDLLHRILQSFGASRTCVVINSGTLIDLSWMDNYPVGAVLLAWQGGQESGRGLADVLIGAETPAGHLTDTAADLEDYPSTDGFGKEDSVIYKEDIYVGYRYFSTFAPEKVRFPFGFGLSYTTFEHATQQVLCDHGRVNVSVNITNAGHFAGKEVLQMYLQAAQGKLGRPALELVAFGCTEKLNPDESEVLTLSFDVRDFAAYDDTGVTGHKHCFVLEEGTYKVFLGTNSQDIELLSEFRMEETVTQQCSCAAGPEVSFERLVNLSGVPGKATVPVKELDLKEEIQKRLPNAIVSDGEMKDDLTLADVKAGRCTMEEFILSLSVEEMEALSRGGLEGMYSLLGPNGNAGVFGGNSAALQAKGIPAVSTNDGPSGARLQAHSTLFPCGTLLAGTFDTKLMNAVGKALGKEVRDRKSHVLLAPGLNIHRNPLCGRNFEYYSEDPFLTGMMGAAYVRGLQSEGTSAVIKHFACNNQETDRIKSDSILSSRALREIYLKGFRICIREAKPDFVMTSYNKINGCYTYYNYELCTLILREEWNYEGLVMTDWWIRDGQSPEFKNVLRHGYRIRSGVNIYMPGNLDFFDREGTQDGTVTDYLGMEEGPVLGELQQNARRVLEYCLSKL